MRRVYYDAKTEAEKEYAPGSTNAIIYARDLLTRKVGEVLELEGWTKITYRSRQTVTCNTIMAHFDPILPASWYSVGWGETNYIFADELPPGYSPKPGYEIGHVFGHMPSTVELAQAIANLLADKLKAEIFSVTAAGVTFGWDSPDNLGVSVGVGVALHCTVSERYRGGYILTSAKYPGTNNQITMYHGVTTNFLGWSFVYPEIRFGLITPQDEWARYTPTFSSYMGDRYPVYIYATPYSVSIVPVGAPSSYDYSVHAAAMSSAVLGICSLSFHYRMKADGFGNLTYIRKDGMEYINSVVRLATLRYHNPNFMSGPIKWISGEAQLSDVFVTRDNGTIHELVGKYPMSFISYDSVVDPESTSYDAKVTLRPITKNVVEVYDQTIGTMVHRCS